MSALNILYKLKLFLLKTWLSFKFFSCNTWKLRGEQL